MLYISTRKAIHLSVFLSVNGLIDQTVSDYETFFGVYITLGVLDPAQRAHRPMKPSLSRRNPVNQVFISYSHRDAPFVDRLVRDLRYSDVPATYDKWLLRVGDSIIGKIAQTVAESDKVIAVISKASVKSAWVTKEISLAMTGEVNGRKVKVLPVVIDDCKLPHTLMDKLFADFRDSYYWGLQKLLDAIDARGDSRSWAQYGRTKIDPRQAAETLEVALSTSNREAVRDWARANASAMLSLVGHRWSLSEVIDDFRFGSRAANCDLLVVNGQSYCFDFRVIRFGPASLCSASGDALREEVTALQLFVDECHADHDEFCRAASIRFSKSQIAPPSFMGYPDRHSHRHKLVGTVFAGRRHEYGDIQNSHREALSAASAQRIKIASYDRLLEAIIADATGKRR